MQITFNQTPLNLVPDTQHEFLLTNKEVALGYGITANNLSKHKSEHSDELIEGKHWIRKVSATNGGKQRVINWTKKGIVRLGFFIKSQKAKEFRDWAEDYIVNSSLHVDKHRIKFLEDALMLQNRLIAEQSQTQNTAQDNNNIKDSIFQLEQLNKENILFLKQIAERITSIDNFTKSLKSRHKT